jgi:GDP-L-fucose synthase
MLGSSLRSRLERDGEPFEISAPSHGELDLRDRDATRHFVEAFQPDVVLHAAARVAGIAAKLAAPMDFLLDNLLMDTSVIDAAVRSGVPRLLYVGTAAAYPAEYERPFTERDLLSGPLERPNEGYALSKIAAVKLCEYAAAQHGLTFRAALPSNLYGPHDHFGSGDAHLIAAALTKVHRAKVQGEHCVEVWGDGTARREFTYSEDLADWLVSQLPVLEAWPAWLNLGVSEDHSVADYYEIACDVVGYHGQLHFDTSKPSGVPRRMIDSEAAHQLGWNPTTSIREGMAAAYAAFLAGDTDTRETV